MKVKLLRSKRALSPVVSALFLFGVILGAIAVSLGIIYPQLDELNETVNLETAATSLLTLDQDMKNLILSGGTGSIVTTLDLGDSGLLIGDETSSIVLNLMKDDQFLTNPYYMKQSRLIVRHKTDQDVVAQDTTLYLTGSGYQELYFLNSTTKDSIPWTMLTEVRFSDQYIYTIFSYRNIITASKIVADLTFQVNVTLEIQSVNFNFLNTNQTGSSNPTLDVEYTGMNITSTPWLPSLTSPTYLYFILKSQTNLYLSGSSLNENPLTHEVPESPGELNVQLQFITHNFDISITA
ncbi:MAG: hypothetical protein ACXAD7_16040 [Candidatus Kariarchaeaceae archaeon]|jgi:hypothetical protein